MSNSFPLLGTDNLAFVESLYSRFLEDPNSVPEDFRRFFENEHPAHGSVRIGPSFTAPSLFDPAGSSSIHVAVQRNGVATNGGVAATNGNGNGSSTVAVLARGATKPSSVSTNGNGNSAHANGALSLRETNGVNGTNGAHAQHITPLPEKGSEVAALQDR